MRLEAHAHPKSSREKHASENTPTGLRLIAEPFTGSTVQNVDGAFYSIWSVAKIADLQQLRPVDSVQG